MTLNDKIKTIIQNKNLSPSIFADEIGVQRSSISHILAGRNKPSLEVIQKIVKRFPDLGLKWVMDETVPVPEVAAIRKAANAPVRKPGEGHDTVEPRDVADRKIDKVLIFYSDGTFEEFKGKH